MNPKEYLLSIESSTIKLGLDRTIELMDACGNPQNDLSIIQIAGTNGKGSCSALIESILRISGKKVGLFTSPHLINFNERIRVDGIPIKNFDIISFIEKSLNSIMNITGLEDYQARECGPYPHGFVSSVRFLLWKCLRAFIIAWNLVEVGNMGSRVFTRVFLGSARKRAS